MEAEAGQASSPEERTAKERRFHTCGQAIWFAEQLSGPAFYDETAPLEYAFVTHCPRCEQTLTEADLRMNA